MGTCVRVSPQPALVHRLVGRGPRVVVSTAAFHASIRGSVPGRGGLKETKMFLPHPRVKVSIVGSLRDREVACSASDRQGSNFESCVWRTVSPHSSHHPQEVLLAQFSLYVHKGGLKPDSFHFHRLVFAALQWCNPANTKQFIAHVERRPNVLYKCYKTILCLLGSYLERMLGRDHLESRSPRRVYRCRLERGPPQSGSHQYILVYRRCTQAPRHS